MDHAQKKIQAKAQRKAARFLRALHDPMKEHEVRIRLALPFQRATPELRHLIREHLERLQVALLAEGHSVVAEVYEMRHDRDTGGDVVFARWDV